jgi:uncharacterized protein (DUF2236 family)
VGRRTAPGRALTEGATEGLYGPSSEAWRLNREALLLLGAGPRALLLQIAHPLVAEGVDQHSDFREDPWRRLAATLDSYLTIVYGSEPAARAEIRRLNALHRRVSGPVTDPVARAVVGETYRARDPELSLWVHATLVDSTIVAYDAWIEPLSRERRARFYAETCPVGLAFGIPDELLPGDYEAFEAYVEAMLAPGGPIVVTPAARALARTILHPPLWPLAPRLRPLISRLPPSAYDWTMWPALDLLPASIRTGFGIADSPVRRAVAGWLVTGWRAWRPLIPTALRWMPDALAADRRLARRARDGRPPIARRGA